MFGAGLEFFKISRARTEGVKVKEAVRPEFGKDQGSRDRSGKFLRKYRGKRTSCFVVNNELSFQKMEKRNEKLMCSEGCNFLASRTDAQKNFCFHLF